MKKFELKQLGLKSTFKFTIYISIVPLAFILIMGIFAAIIGFALNLTELKVMGIMYCIMAFFFLAVYGAFGMLIALVYNKLANKFGGLEIVLEEKELQ